MLTHRKVTQTNSAQVYKLYNNDIQSNNYFQTSIYWNTCYITIDKTINVSYGNIPNLCAYPSHLLSQSPHPRPPHQGLHKALMTSEICLQCGCKRGDFS